MSNALPDDLEATPTPDELSEMQDRALDEATSDLRRGRDQARQRIAAHARHQALDEAIAELYEAIVRRVPRASPGSKESAYVDGWCDAIDTLRDLRTTPRSNRDE